jgi:NADH:ubiquinone oxidoreductase subunit
MQPKRRTGVTLPPELHEWLHAQQNLSSVVEEALEEWRARHEQGERSE